MGTIGGTATNGSSSVPWPTALLNPRQPIPQMGTTGGTASNGSSLVSPPTSFHAQGEGEAAPSGASEGGDWGGCRRCTPHCPQRHRVRYPVGWRRRDRSDHCRHDVGT